MFAGGGGWNIGTNTSFYLYTGKNWWTMSPYNWRRGNSWAFVFFVYQEGYISSAITTDAYGVRPVITLKGDTIFKANTDGTINKPYEIA